MDCQTRGFVYKDYPVEDELFKDVFMTSLMSNYEKLHELIELNMCLVHVMPRKEYKKFVHVFFST